MSHSFALRGTAASLVAYSLSATLTAGIVDTYSVGVGDNSATIQIDFESGAGYLFDVRWSANSFSSWDAMLAIDAQLNNVSMQFDTYSFGVFLTGVTVNADTNYGQGDVDPYENYWHYWVQNSSQWELAQFGASDHALVNGALDAWVFGSSALPQSVPAPSAIMLMSACLFARRRRS